MKLINNIWLKSSLILCLFLINYSLQSKKEVSMMEFMNSYYSTDKKASDLLEKNYNEEAKEIPKIQETATDYSFAQSKETKKKHKKHKLKLKSRKIKHKNLTFKTHLKKTSHQTIHFSVSVKPTRKPSRLH